MISIKNISYKVGKKEILKNIDTTFHSGKMHFLLGPNGSGKSSLLRLIAGQLNANMGSIVMDNQIVNTLSLKEFSQKRAFLQQQLHIPFPISVDEVIMMGRFPHFTFQPSPKDFKIVSDLIDLCDLQLFRNRLYHTLSGGEQQRVQFARVLAQIWDTQHKNTYLLLDEPLNNLDVQYQKAILEILKQLQLKNYTIMMVVHDLNWALQYAQNVILMKKGEILFQGPPEEVINSQNIERVYNVKSSFWNNALGKQAISYL